VCDPVAPASLVAEVELQGRTARLILDLGYTDAQAAVVVRDLADGMLSQIETLLANRTTDLPAHLRGALTGLADALAEQSAGEATVTALDTPLTRAWRAHPAGRGR
jgi:acetamidase/formamidase